jgi:hypothetical protein
MVTNLSLKAQLQDCDRRILLNHSRQEAIVFVRNGSRDSMHERVNSEGALCDFGALGRWVRFERAKLEWETTIDMMVEHRRTCPDCPRRITAQIAR